MLRFFNNIGMDINKFKIHIQLPNHLQSESIDNAEQFWSEQLNMPKEQFNKTTYQSNHKKHDPKYPMGVCYMTYFNEMFNYKLKKWMELALEEL
jgi:hypothetical protein